MSNKDILFIAKVRKKMEKTERAQLCEINLAKAESYLDARNIHTHIYSWQIKINVNIDNPAAFAGSSRRHVTIGDILKRDRLMKQSVFPSKFFEIS